jgi:hypothetical protein
VATVEVIGVKQMLQDLRQIDPEARKQFAKDAKQIASPIIVAAQAKYPAQALSGMRYRWTQNGRQLFPWDQRKARRGVQVKVDAGRKKDGVVTIIQKDPAASIYDIAGRGTSNRLGDALTAFAGNPSRVMWPSAEAHITDVQAEMTKALEQVATEINRRIAAI